jgi:4-hydroxy-tetrahydrodipicolinate reductase
MKISIIGYGKMGHAVEAMAKSQSIGIASIIDPSGEGSTHKAINGASLKGADVAIDFTTPGSVLENIERVSSLGKNIVVGTTGWYKDLENAKKIIKKSGTGMVYSPNFSIGVNLFFRIVSEASSMMNRFPMYDPFVYEIHHRQKTDAPGGTAKVLGDIVIKNIDRKKRMAFDRIDGRKIAEDELHVASIRAGYIPGTHVVGFDGEADTIELKHTARSRSGFAEGAILASKWINGKKGFYTLEDIISTMIGDKP